MKNVHVIAALALLAGGTVSLHAAEVLTVAAAPKGSGSAIAFNGATFHETTNRVVNHRTITFRSSPTVMVTWAEPTRTGTTSYFAISRTGEQIDQVMATENIVRLRYAQFDPILGAPAIPEVLRATPDNELMLVQFVGTPLEEMREEIRAMGGVVERFLTDNTHVIRIPAKAQDAVAALPYVRWMGDYHPAYRLDEELLATIVLGGERTPEMRVSIECMRRGMEQQQVIADLVRARGGLVDVHTPDQFRMEVTVSLQTLIELVHRNEINFIDAWGGPGGTDMDLIRQVGGAVPVLSNAGFLGQGVRGEIFDTGIINNHVQWNGQIPLINGQTATDSHGVACYGINFATGTGNAQATGMMPQREQGIFSFYNATTQFSGNLTRLSLNTAATDPNGQFRSVFQTSSVGSPQVGNYTTVSAEVDDYLWRVQYLSCQSQSNTGNRNSRPQAWAKNIVSVGGVNHNESINPANHTASGASVGPASDLRVKPDLAHSYGNIFTTYSTSTTGYGQFGGTSGATPITCGHFGLLHQMWHEEVWEGFGGGSSVFHSRPRSTTAKALMINTAYRYPTTQLQRYRVGWGMAHVANMYNLREKTFIVDESELLTNGQSISFNLNVEPGEPEFKVTMVYSDPQGNPAAAQQRINDLTLKVTSPTSVVYWGNNGMIATAISGAGQLEGANYTVPGGSANTVDTVENVFIQNPMAGTWTVEVIASQIVADAVLSTPAIDASFALVATGGTAGPPAAVRITFPGGMPYLVSPGTAHPVTVNIVPGSQQILAGSPRVHVRTSPTGPFTAIPLQHAGGDQYTASLPVFSCGDEPELYFSAQGELGETVTLPRNAPQTLFSTNIGTMVSQPILTQNFVTAWPVGWSATGLWHVSTGCLPGGTPCSNGPFAYFGRAATCNYNLPTGAHSGILTGPNIQIPTLPPGGTATVSFCYSLETENHPNFDKAELFVNGQTKPEWRLADAQWATANIDLSEFAGETVTLSWRFNTVTGTNNTFRGWHVDNIRVEASTVTCEQSCYANCDNSTTAPVLNIDDFTCFINKFAEGSALPPAQQVTHYANCDGSTTAPALNIDDFTCFINAFALGCP